MNDSARSNDRLRSILVILATVATIGFSALAATGYLNGVTTAEISDRFPTVITPAGYAFSIWNLIYVGLLAFSVYQAIPKHLERFGRVRTLYIASCVLNCAWIYFWHHGYIGGCVVLIIALAIVLTAITSMYKFAVSLTEALIVKGTFGLYAGWVTVASIVNIAVYLRSVGSAAAMSEVVGTLAVIIATAAAVAVTWRLANYLYPVAVAWTLTAVAINQSGKTAIVIACAGGVIMSLLLATSFVLSFPSTARTESDNE
jgi:benzodiazapine receptor